MFLVLNHASALLLSGLTQLQAASARPGSVRIGRLIESGSMPHRGYIGLLADPLRRAEISELRANRDLSLLLLPLSLLLLLQVRERRCDTLADRSISRAPSRRPDLAPKDTRFSEIELLRLRLAAVERRSTQGHTQVLYTACHQCVDSSVWGFGQWC